MQNSKEIIRTRIVTCKDADSAKDVYLDLLNERHNDFAREFCLAINLEYRNDVPSQDICLEVLPYDIASKVRYCTPDNYVVYNNKLYIIDFKVSVDDVSSRETIKKYNEIFGEILVPNGIPFEVVIIRFDPIRSVVIISSPEFNQLITPYQLDYNVKWFDELKSMLFDKFKEDERFLEIISQGEFTLTTPWTMEDTPELFEHENFIEFIESLPEEERYLFMESLDRDPFEDDKWSDRLKNIKLMYEDYYKSFVKSKAQEIFLKDGNYPKPSAQEIDQGWQQMISRVKIERNLTNNVDDQKPSFHFIWSKPNAHNPTKNNEKIIMLSKCLQNIKTKGKYTNAFKAIGKLMDFSGDIAGYEAFCTKLKHEVKKVPGKINSNIKLEPKKFGSAVVFWEQQFKLSLDEIDIKDKNTLLKEYFGIGKHKRFSQKMMEDITQDKPEILNFENKDIIDKSIFKMNEIKDYLSEKTQITTNTAYINEYIERIKDASNSTFENIKSITESYFWNFINDYSTLMKNMLSVSQYNKHNTFRVVCCANNSVYGLVFPSTDIKTRKSTLVYCVITIHKERHDVCEHGSSRLCLETKDGFISISKAFRLDKERCQRIVTSPGLFLLTTCLLKSDNPNLDVYDVANFSLHTSLSVTKAMLSLTEPSRYMIMNSLAVSSHVKEYIAEKFSPYTKTLFSVYVTNLIKNGCYMANKQRENVKLRNIYLTDFDIMQKGVNNERDLTSIWFPGLVNLKEYINQIYLPFYFNAKGLHEKHHTLIDLAKTILEIEKDQRENIICPWSEIPQKQTVNLKVLIYSIAKNLLLDTSRHNYVRSRIENANNLKRSISTVSTFTSSKSCIKIGNFREIKMRSNRNQQKLVEKEVCKYTIANPLFAKEHIDNLGVKHSTYEDLINSIPNYVDHISTKVFDRLYEQSKSGKITDKPLVEIIMDTMKNHNEFYFGFFNKGQKTAKDREIFVGEFEAKMCLYLVERISKERCKLNPDEMISEPGDSKLRKLEQISESEMRYMASTIKDKNREINEQLETSRTLPSEIQSLLSNKPKGLKIEINADMSKWSAQDVLYKYFWLFCLDPVLYPTEKKRILYFLCNYLNKKLILPDEMLMNILDQKIVHENDLIGEMTDYYQNNTVNIKKNWLQGNMNYTSSYLHTCSMSVYKDILKEASDLLEGDILVNSMVHSDDNHTSISWVQSKLSDEVLIQFAIDMFEMVCLTFGNQANMKKTYLTYFIKEFVSLFNIYGEPFSIFGRFLLTAVGDCAYLGPYEDFASRLSATQTAIKHGCPASLAWLSIALNQWLTHTTYNMMPGQINDPIPHFPTMERSEIPLELCGTLSTDLATLAMVGLESDNLTYLTNLSIKMSNIMIKKETIQSQFEKLDEWDLSKLTKMDIIRLKMLRYISLDSVASVDDGMGETSDMRSRSLLTPRKFMTSASLSRLISYQDFQMVIKTEQEKEDLFNYFIDKPELLVTKGETLEEYCKSILYRYNSKKFKESLSIQNPSQLFIEQILFSSKPTIDYSSIFDRMFGLQDHEKVQEMDTIIGRKTFNECYQLLQEDLSKFTLELEDIKTVYSYCLLNDPLLVTCSNNIIMSIRGTEHERLAQSSSTMPEMRSLKLITHSPAVVLRSYIHNKFDFPKVEEEELRRDVVHLENFVEKTHIREKMLERIAEKRLRDGKDDKLFQLKELTKFYQICYDYIKSTEHKVKIFILPYKVYTSAEFCCAVTGNLISDNKWCTIHYLKPIVSTSHKAQVAINPDTEIKVAMECFRLICHFADMFLSEFSRINFLKSVIEEFTYHNIPVKILYQKLLNSRFRTKYLSVLFYTNTLTQKDLDKFDAEKTEDKISWNDWQSSREMSTGVIDLIITSPRRKLKIYGEDDQLIAAELEIFKIDNSNIQMHGQAALNKPHGLKFEKMRPITEMSSKLHYIVYQQRAKRRYFYSILPKSIIEEHNDRVEASKMRTQAKWIPVCPVAVSELIRTSRPMLYDIKYLNSENTELSRLKISVEEYQIIQRVSFQKAIFLEGPVLDAGGLNVNELMKSTSILTSDFDKLIATDLLTLSRIFDCDGSQNSDSFEFLSDEIIDTNVTEKLECNPIFNISYNIKGNKRMTYRNAIKIAVSRATQDFEECMDFSGEGFYSNENISIIECIHWIIQELKTNQWSTDLDRCFHLMMRRGNLDEQYHMFDIPIQFMKTPITREIWWFEVNDFLDALAEHDIKISPWKTIIENFLSKAKELVKNKIKEKKKKKKVTDFVSKKDFGGHSKFEFQ
uniref:RNA-directed RNA polymerase L n=1 Tax=Leanyer virus TaxID=999729 RepID=A0A513S712_9VIRU|nr:polymerase [Leanyer virus]